MVTPISASMVARPALVRVYELTALNMSPKLAHTAGSQGLSPLQCTHMCSELRNSPGHAGKDLGCPCCSRISPQTLPPRSSTAEWLVY